MKIVRHRLYVATCLLLYCSHIFIFIFVNKLINSDFDFFLGGDKIFHCQTRLGQAL